MPKTVQIGSNPLIIPEQGDNPGWGEDTTAWMEAVTNALGNVQGPNDLLITSATLANNQTSASNIPGLTFNVAQVESVEIYYLIKRTFDSGASVITETGTIIGDYDGSEFTMSSDTNNDVGVEISVLNSGQFQYTSSDLANHISTIIRFRAKSIDTP